MFTGLIETTGIVKSTRRGFQVEAGKDLELIRGDSLAVNGSCLTVIKTEGRQHFIRKRTSEWSKNLIE